MEGDTPVHDATILVDGSRILSVKAGGEVPAGVRTIDAQGKPVTPGLVNGATQIGLVEISGSDDTVDTASRDERKAGDDVSRALNGNSPLVRLARAAGPPRAPDPPSPPRPPPFPGPPPL